MPRAAFGDIPRDARTNRNGGGAEGILLCDPGSELRPLRGAIVNRTYGIHKNLYICLFLPTIFGPIYCGPP